MFGFVGDIIVKEIKDEGVLGEVLGDVADWFFY